MSSGERVARAAARWRGLRELAIGEDFVGRLAAVNGWSRARAQAADREYRRFLLIASVSPRPVVPSPDVDRAWHEHILHTRSYAEMCGILGFTLHHEPGRTDGRDAADHAEGYRGTLDLYRRIFQGDPPEDVWPTRTNRQGLLGRIGGRLGFGGRAGAVVDDGGGTGWAMVPAMDAGRDDDGKDHGGHAADGHAHGHADEGAHASCGGHAGCGGHGGH